MGVVVFFAGLWVFEVPEAAMLELLAIGAEAAGAGGVAASAPMLKAEATMAVKRVFKKILQGRSKEPIARPSQRRRRDDG